MMQPDLFDAPGAWELPRKGYAFPIASVEVEPCASGWAYGACFHSTQGCYEGGGFGVRGGKVAPTRSDAISAALDWIGQRIVRFPREAEAFARWRTSVR